MILGLQNQSARRKGTPTNTGGVITSTPATDFDFVGAIQPLNPKEREALDQGFATRAKYKVFTYDTLYPLTDFVKHRGQWCEVFSRDDWQDAPWLAHNEYVLLKPEPDA